MRRLIAIGVILTAVSAIPLASAARSEDQTAAKILPSLVKIVAECGNPTVTRIASGFRWGEPDQIVTDMHVVIGCRSPVSVLFFVADASGLRQTLREATITHVVPAHDLVLLTVKDAPPGPVLSVAAPPPPGAWLEAWGFPFGVEAPVNTRLQVMLASNLFPALSTMLDDSARAQLQRLHFPSLDTPVLHLSGPLEPGDSGGPVLNAAGQVVGIGSGGLQQGAASISWAIRADLLADLPRAPDQLPTAGLASTLFAYVVQPGPPMLAAPSRDAAREPHQPPLSPSPALSPPLSPSPFVRRATADGIRCGEQVLFLRGSARADEILRTAYDPAVIGAMVGDTGGKLADFAAERFDIWVDPRSGAAGLVPAGAVLRAADGQCVADIAGSAVTLLLRATPLPRDPATPEWLFAAETARWNAFVLEARFARSGFRTLVMPRDLPPERPPAGTSVLRWQLRGRPGLRLWRAELQGRGASLSEGALTDRANADGSVPPAIAAAWAKAVLAVALASFPPPDAALGTVIPAALDADTPDGQLAPAETEQNPSRGHNVTVRCGDLALIRLSAAVSAESLLRHDDLAANIAARLAKEEKTVPERFARAAFTPWGAFGMTVLLPRGRPLEPVRDGKTLLCRMTFPITPDVQIILATYHLGNPAGRLAERIEEFRRSLEQKFGLTLGAMAELPASRVDTAHVKRWLGAGTGKGGERQTVAMMAEAREGLAILAVVVAPAEPEKPRPPLAAKMTGLLLPQRVNISD